MLFDAPRSDEFPLIYDAWARSFRKSPWAGCIPNSLYDQVSRASIGEILDRGARVIVAVTPLGEDPDARRVMGYSVSEPDTQTLHWLFVKKDYRGLGFGRQILDETASSWDPRRPWLYTHRTRASARFLGNVFTWDPTSARVKR